jgi:tetratricopeptide (TPR) repeat protein
MVYRWHYRGETLRRFPLFIGRHTLTAVGGFMHRCNSYRSFIVGCVAGCVALFPSLLCAAPAMAQDADAAALQHFTAAHKAQDAGDLEAAAREYSEVIRLRPDAAEAYASLGLVYNAQGKFAESARALGKAERLKPGLPGVSLYLGIDYEEQRQASAALPHLVEAVRRDAGSKDANIWLGRALWDEGRTQQALQQIRKTSELFPDDPALLLESGETYHKAAELNIQRVIVEATGTPLLHQVYGDVYQDKHLWEAAMAHYYRALELDPHWHGAHFGLGDVALHREKLEVAAQEYHHELETNPASASALARLAEIAMLQGKLDEALGQFSAAIQLSRYEAADAVGLPEAYPPGSEDLSDHQREQMQSSVSALQAAPASPARSLALALAHARLGDKENPDWKAFAEDVPRTTFANAYERGRYNFHRQDFAEAAVNLDGWLKTHPNDLKAAYVLGIAYRNLSLNTLAQLLAVAPDSYPAHELLAETYQNTEQDEKALAEYRVVASMAPNLQGVHFAIGHLLAKKGQSDAARDEFAAELRLDPDHAEANAEMGKLLLDQQKTTEAIPYLEKALKANPDLWATYNELGRAYYTQKDLPKAEAALRQAVRHDPQGLAHYQLGLVYRSLGQKDEANAQFEISRKLKLEALTHDETKMTTLKALPQ